MTKWALSQGCKDSSISANQWFFLWSCMDVRVGLWRRLSTEELMRYNCGVGEDSWESADYKEVQPVHSEGDQPWDFFGKNDAEAETPVLWPPLAKSWLIRKDFDPGRDWGQEEKGTTKHEMAGWHHWLKGHESEWTPGDGDGQGGLACRGSCGRKESDTTERFKWTELFVTLWILACQVPLPMRLPGKNTGVGCHFLLRGSFQARDWTHVSHVSCIGSLGSLPLVPPRYLGLNLIYFIRENTFSTNLSSILFFFFEQINVSFLPLQRYCNREEPWLHIDSVPLRLMLCCQCLEMLALHLL